MSVCQYLTLVSVAALLGHLNMSHFWPQGYSGTAGDVAHTDLLSPGQGGIPPTYQPNIQYKNVDIIAQYILLVYISF